MKKTFGKFLLLTLAFALVASMCALAAPTSYVPGDDGAYSVGYTEGAEGKYYALLVVSGIYDEGETPAISEDTVLYIDQATADADGDVSFDGWIPKDDVEATVYLGGTEDGPVLLGYLAYDSNKFTVSGKVSTDSATTYEATVTLSDGTNTYSAVSAEGTYSVEVPAGTYTFKVNVKNHLSYTDEDFVVAENVSGKNVTVKGGDIDGINGVEYEDFAAVVNNYLTETDVADIDGDGMVEYDDYAKVVNNYGEDAVVE